MKEMVAASVAQCLSLRGELREGGAAIHRHSICFNIYFNIYPSGSDRSVKRSFHLPYGIFCSLIVFLKHFEIHRVRHDEFYLAVIECAVGDRTFHVGVRDHQFEAGLGNGNTVVEVVTLNTVECFHELTVVVANMQTDVDIVSGINQVVR